MSLTLPAILTKKCPTSLYLSLSRTHFLKSSNFILLPPNSTIHSRNDRFFSSYDHILRLSRINSSFEESLGNIQKRSDSRDSFTGLKFDLFLSILEFLSLSSAAAISIYLAVNCGLQNRDIFKLGNKIFVWQCLALVTGVVIGALIRHRQWRLIFGPRSSKGSFSAGIISSERVEKLEEDLRSLAGTVRVLSKQLEKLGIRFRITRKALKEPITQTAALVQKNSEVTRALAAQEDILESELGEIQKVLLAMQEQQQKQLELIIAISKAGNVWETKNVKASKMANSDINQIEALKIQKESHKDKV